MGPADKWRATANAAFSSGDFGGAVAAYTQSLSAEAVQPTVLSNRAMAHLKLGNYAAAEQDCVVGLQQLDDVEAGVVVLSAGASVPPGLRVKVCLAAHLCLSPPRLPCSQLCVGRGYGKHAPRTSTLPLSHPSTPAPIVPSP